MPTPAEVISIYPIAQYLAANDIQRKGKYAAGIDYQLALKIYNFGTPLSKRYLLDPTDDTLQGVANFVYTLCGKWYQQALGLTGSGGTVAPVTSPDAIIPYNFIVSASSFIANGVSSKSIPLFRGLNLSVSRNGVPQSTVTTEPTYYGWNKTTNQFIIYPAVVTTELIIITPV